MMKLSAWFIPLFLCGTLTCSGVEPTGVIKRVEATPVDLQMLSITFERLSFVFDSPVEGRFWIEFRRGEEKVVKQEVPHDKVPATTRFDLALVQTSDHSAFVSVTTTHDGKEDRRTGSYGYGNSGGTRTVSYKPVSDHIPLGADVELFNSEIKPGWRHSEDPTLYFRIMAHFSSPK